MPKSKSAKLLPTVKVMLKMHTHKGKIRAICYDREKKSYEMCRWELGWCFMRSLDANELQMARKLRRKMHK